MLNVKKHADNLPGNWLTKHKEKQIISLLNQDTHSLLICGHLAASFTHFCIQDLLLKVIIFKTLTKKSFMAIT